MREIPWSIPRRYLRLRLFDGRKTLSERCVLSNLDERFKVSGNISASVSGAASEANITIGGLKRDTMVFLATNFSTWTKNQIQNEVNLDIGYDNNHAIMFVGSIIDAVPKMDTQDYSIQLKCLSQFPKMLNDLQSLSFSGNVTVAQIAKNIASILEYTLRITNAASVFTVNNYSLSNQPIQNHLRYLSELTGLQAYIEQDTVIVKKRNETLRVPTRYKIDSNNMIGAPRPTNSGTVVKVKLDPRLRTGIEAVLNSQKFPTLNDGEYSIATIGTVFDTRGNDWYNELTLMRKDIYTL